MNAPEVAKRRGRPPKIVAEVVAPVTPNSVSWSEVKQMVVDRNRHGHQIASVSHPEPLGDLVETSLGNVRVVVGPESYTLTTGEVIEI